MARPETPLLTVDCVAIDHEGRIALIRRRNPPFQGALALPGGFVDIGETVEAACRRELLEETSLVAGELTLLGVYSDPRRDPRGHTCSIVYVTDIGSQVPTAGDDAAAVEMIANWREHDLAFDHAKILADAENLRRA